MYFLSAPFTIFSNLTNGNFFRLFLSEELTFTRLEKPNPNPNPALFSNLMSGNSSSDERKIVNSRKIVNGRITYQPIRLTANGNSNRACQEERSENNGMSNSHKKETIIQVCFNQAECEYILVVESKCLHLYYISNKRSNCHMYCLRCILMNCDVSMPYRVSFAVDILRVNG